MLNFIVGRNYCDKTEYVREIVKKGIDEGKNNFIIIVPEQFSFETERGMLSKIGAEGMLKVDVLSLSRLAEIIIEESGNKSSKRTVDDGVRMLTMNIALDSLHDELSVFKKYASRPTLTQNLVSLATELKQCDVTTDDFAQFAENSETNSLKLKLQELVKIISLYDAMLSQSYYNTDDSLTVLCKVLDEYRFFENKTVIFDEFTRFTKQELNVVEKIIKQSENVYISLNTDIKELDNEYSIFANINAQYKKLINICKNDRIEIAPVKEIGRNLNISNDLICLETGFGEPRKTVFDNAPTDIELVKTPNKTEECNYVAASVKRLMREKNVRCRDIIVYERTKNDYDRELAAAFKRYGVPFYEDKRQPVNSQPIIVYIRALLDIASRGINTESLLRLLKTGLTDIPDSEISELENYAFLWKIKASQWRDEFTENPNGFGFEIRDEDEEKLTKLNEIRARAVAPVLAFRKKFSEAQGEEKTAILYSHLIDCGINERQKELAVALRKEGKTALCEEQNAVWSLLVEMLDKLYLASQNYELSNKRYIELFEILLSVSDLGEVPSGLDDVTLGVADRTRAGLKKYVFIIGANEGVFPVNPKTQGILNDKDRIELRESGIVLAETADYKQVEESYTAYRTVCSATEKLFISYSATNYVGEGFEKSMIVDEIQTAFPKLEIKNYENEDVLLKIESDDSAFEMLAQSYNNNKLAFNTISEYFKDNELFKGKVETLKNAAQKRKVKIEDTNIATELFNRDMYLSASKAEVYYDCPFEYFCKFGIKAKPRKPAEFDPALNGTVIHDCFEHLFQVFTKEELEEATDEILLAEINKILNNYLNEKMGGDKGKSPRFMAFYNSVSNRVLSIFKRMIAEFKNSEFYPCDFELKIGYGGEIPPYELKLSDGGSLLICGSIDRVDTMQKDDKLYLRVVDYKLNGKDFELGNVLFGIKMQMLIYLYALYTNGKQKYGDFIPSGVLYMSAKPAKPDLNRDATNEQIEKELLTQNRMSGIVLDDMTVAQGMEHDLNKYYINVKLDKKSGLLKGDVIPFNKLINLKDDIDKLLSDMALNLHNGNINAYPTNNQLDNKDACKYCDYKDVCGFEQGDEIRDIPKINFNEALSKISDREVENSGNQLE